LAELAEGTGTEYEPMLSAEELEVAKANLRFALEDCPVDGGVLIEDGGTSSRESVEALLKKLESVEAPEVRAIALGSEDLKLLKAVAEYAIDECPIGGGMMLDDGTLVSKTDLVALREKVAILAQAFAPKCARCQQLKH
jgi:hypothetical protein